MAALRRMLWQLAMSTISMKFESLSDSTVLGYWVSCTTQSTGDRHEYEAKQPIWSQVDAYLRKEFISCDALYGHGMNMQLPQEY